MRALAESIISVIAPHRCLGCDSVGVVLCESCRGSELIAPPSRCYNCRAVTTDSVTCAKCRSSSRLKHVWVGSDYVGLTEGLVRLIKFERCQAAAQVMAKHLAENLPFIMCGTLVVHVPTASSRVRVRGYDQSELLARALAKELGLEHQALLRRKGQTRQVGTKRKQRLEQLKGALEVINPDMAKDTCVLLVDDVLTTGATLEAAAKILKQAGAKTIDAAVFAQA